MLHRFGEWDANSGVILVTRTTLKITRLLQHPSASFFAFPLHTSSEFTPDFYTLSSTPFPSQDVRSQLQDSFQKGQNLNLKRDSSVSFWNISFRMPVYRPGPKVIASRPSPSEGLPH
ncbi:hypothetical protein TNCV_4926521 [Trichonephila clavipes]|nr:hypothetical protein TNCV_4926521 [Trichonephila clavipes]